MALAASASAKFNDGKSRRLSSPINPGYYGKKELNRRLKGIDSSDSNDEPSLSSSVDTEWSWSQSEDTSQDSSTDDRRKLKKKEKKRKAPKKKPSTGKKKENITDETTTKKKQKKKSSSTPPPPPTASQTRAPTPPPSTFPPKISNIEPANDDLVG